MARQASSSAEIFRIADRLHSGAIRLLRGIRRADLESGLSPQRLSALSVIVFAGPVSVGRLAEAEQVSAPTISRLVKGLEKAGLVRRRSDDRDTRVTLLEATASGKKILERGRRRRIDLLVSHLSRLGAKDRKLLDRAAALMESMAPGGATRSGAAARGKPAR